MSSIATDHCLSSICSRNPALNKYFSSACSLFLLVRHLKFQSEMLNVSSRWRQGQHLRMPSSRKEKHRNVCSLAKQLQVPPLSSLVLLFLCFCGLPTERKTCNTARSTH